MDWSGSFVYSPGLGGGKKVNQPHGLIFGGGEFTEEILLPNLLTCWSCGQRERDKKWH